MLYPPCPNCGHQLPIGDFYREVGARRLSIFRVSELSDSPGFRKDPYTGEEVPVQFSITCAPCGATSAVNTSDQDKTAALVLGAGLVLLLLGVLVLARLASAYVVTLFVIMYLGAFFSILRVLSVFMSRTIFTVTLTSVPDSEREKETYAERWARSDHDAAVEIARLGPDFQQVSEPEPLEPELADVAARIDAAHAAAPQAASARPEYELAEEEELERAKITCAKCGELNQRDFGKCWNCESALPASA
jgi:hypothetical protein